VSDITILEMYVIYHQPKDIPSPYVLRKWNLGDEGLKTEGEFATGETLDEIRSLLPNYLIKLPRDPNDDPVIVETWI
jgi:hypothetical protein